MTEASGASADATADVVVVGAGPAGAFLAGLLAAAGVDVLLVGPHRYRPPTGLQSLAPAAAALLADEGVDLAGVHRVPLTVVWPGTDAEPSGGATTLLVQRPGFDDGIRAWAVLRGARLLAARARSIEGGIVTVADGRRVRGDSVVNAAGAHSVFADHRERTSARLFGVTSMAALPVGDTGMWVEAMSSGWLWAASIGDGRLWVLTAHDEARPRAEMTERHRERLSAAVVGERLTCEPFDVDPIDLTPTVVQQQRHRCVGDAAVTIDPLAGQGLAVALRSAAQAADEMLRGVPLVRSPADVASAHRDLAAAHYRAARAEFDTPFWRHRATPAP